MIITDKRINLIGGAKAFINALQDDASVQTPYPDLSWWRPIFSLDGLIMLKKWSLFSSSQH